MDEQGCQRRSDRDQGLAPPGRDNLGQPRPTSTDLGQLPLDQPGRAPSANLGQPQPTSTKSAEGPSKCSACRQPLKERVIWCLSHTTIVRVNDGNVSEEAHFVNTTNISFVESGCMMMSLTQR
ncbi:hypothetical protein B0H19DRAFT_1229308 [Mycena capillaripes]|nr:hypothetical protein B0H19DRAFT_1229308 [Mycena capillaripes]